MSKWPMQGHFGHLNFKTFPMTPRTPQCKVFCPLLSNSKHSGVPEDFKSPTLGVWVSSSHLPKVGLQHTWTCIHSFFNQGIWSPNSLANSLMNIHRFFNQSIWKPPFEKQVLGLKPYKAWGIDRFCTFTR
jgi:hypothetical protein